jgi:hypothetical protein
MLEFKSNIFGFKYSYENSLYTTFIELLQIAPQLSIS